MDGREGGREGEKKKRRKEGERGSSRCSHRREISINKYKRRNFVKNKTKGG